MTNWSRFRERSVPLRWNELVVETVSLRFCYCQTTEEITTHPIDEQPSKRQTLNIRIKLEERGLIDRAARASGKTRTDFIDAARRAAEETLLEQTWIGSGLMLLTPFWHVWMRLLIPTIGCNGRCKQCLPGIRIDPFRTRAACRSPRCLGFRLRCGVTERLAEETCLAQPGKQCLAHLRRLR